MTLKLAILALAVLGAWFVLFRPRPKSPPAAPPATPRVALEPCPRCGVYRLPAGYCGCGEPPGSG